MKTEFVLCFLLLTFVIKSSCIPQIESSEEVQPYWRVNTSHTCDPQAITATFSFYPEVYLFLVSLIFTLFDKSLKSKKRNVVN